MKIFIVNFANAKNVSTLYSSPVSTSAHETGIPPHGYVNELAKLCKCSRQTALNTLRYNYPGAKADLVRRTYRTKYATV